MNVLAVGRRVARADFQYIFGRFWTVRAIYGGLRGALETLVPRNSVAAARRGSASGIFPKADVGAIVRTVQNEAIYVGLNLPPEIVEEIRQFALTEPLHAIYDPNGPTFHYSDVKNGVAADGRPMPIGGIKDPARCPAVRKLIDDPALRSIIRAYIGHEPRRIVTILDWSFGSQISDDERRRLKHHVIDYHYDVGGLNFLYAHFYITDTDRHSGAHVMMKRSHIRKPLRMLWGSARASQEAVYKVFGRHNELTIEGPAGTGFIEDTSCYHRASPPKSGDRLMLAIRFIN